MGDTDQAIAEVFRKIEREKALINAATHMRQSTSNAVVQARVDSNIRDGRRNITYLEDKLNELQLRKRGDSSDGPLLPRLLMVKAILLPTEINACITRKCSNPSSQRPEGLFCQRPR